MTHIKIPFSLILPSFYAFTIWDIPNIPVQWRWYSVLGLMAFSLLLQGRQYKEIRPSKLLIAVLALQWLGGLLGIARATDPVQVMYNSAAALAAIATIVLLEHFLSQQRLRALFLVIFTVSASFWAVEVYSRTLRFGEAASATFHSLSYEGGGDKNFISLLFAIVISSLITFALFSGISVKKNRLVWLLQIMSALLLSFFFLFASALTYSRSGLLVCIIGLLTPVTLSLIQRYGFVKSILLSIIGLFLVSNFILTLVPAILPRWNEALERVTNADIVYEFNRGRFDTLEKSLRIISENPFLGVGAGQYKLTPIDVNSRHSLGTSPHSTVLGTIAEGGILTTLSYVVLASAYMWCLRLWDRMSLVDKAITAAWAPFFAMMFLLDIGGVLTLMLPLLSAVHNCYIYKHTNG